MTWIHDNEPFGTLILTAHFKILRAPFVVPHSPGAFYLFRGNCRQPPAKLARLRLYHFSIVPDRRASTSENVTFAFLSIISQSTIRSAICCGCGYIDFVYFYFDQFKFKIQMSSTNRRCISFYPFHNNATIACIDTISVGLPLVANATAYFFEKLLFFFASCISTNISQHSLRHKPPFEPPHHRRLCFVVSLLFLFVLNASSTVCCVSPTLYSLLNESFFFRFVSIIRITSSSHRCAFVDLFFVCLFWFIFADE